MGNAVRRGASLLDEMAAKAMQGPLVTVSSRAGAEHQPDERTPPAGDSAGWPAPMPLPKLPAVPDFPLDLLPDDLVKWIGDAADRARFQPDFAAAASMVALGSVIGRKLGIRLKQRDDWTEYANVWGALIGPPSALKSPAMREAMRPFKALQSTADAAHQIAQSELTYRWKPSICEKRRRENLPSKPWCITPRQTSI